MTRWNSGGIDIRAVNLSTVSREIERELKVHPGSYITVGVEERPYFIPNKGRGRRSMGTNVRTTTSTSLIAAGHEFGNSFQPRRSFLETTVRRFVKTNLQKIADRDYTYVKSFVKALTAKVYDMLIECFVTSGWGTWKALSEKYKRNTGRTEPPLIDTGQLMSALYAQFEGFRVSGKQFGGFMQSDFYNMEDSNPKDKKEIKIDVDKNKAKTTQIKTIKQKAEKAKKEEMLSREEVVARVLAKQRKKGEIAYRQWLGEIGDDYFDFAPIEEIRKRFGV